MQTKRKRTKRAASGAVTVIVAVSALIATGATAYAADEQIIDSTGWDIFYGQVTGGWRYGPSIIINADDSVDLWAAAQPSAGVAWDFIHHRHSNDGGLTWIDDKPALAPTPGSADQLSVCDPGVIKLGQYYYMGYTSTADSRGTDNQLFIARSTQPDGNFEKWNGSGWGDIVVDGINREDWPAPFITYNDDPAGFGIGEPSFVEKDGVLYIYYTYTNGSTNQTRVATADPANPNWPGSVTQQGVAIEREPGGNADGAGSTIVEDSTDVKYVDSLGKFMAVSIGERMDTDSYTIAYESTNGIDFVPSVFANNDKQNFAHNIGMSGTANGHVDTNDANFVAFAYGPTRARWNTHLSPITFGDQPVGVRYRSHLQDTGWTADARDNRISGVQDSGRRLEAIEAQLTAPLPGMSLQYQSYVNGLGWQAAVQSGATSGTLGQSRALNALRFTLQGAVPSGYHVKYRVWQAGGWTPWRLDGQQAGTVGQRIEAVQVFVYQQPGT